MEREFEERTGDWSEDPHRGPNSAVNDAFERGSMQGLEEETNEDEEEFFRHTDPEQEEEWERQFHHEISQELSERDNRVVGDDNYQLLNETVNDEIVEAEYLFDLSSVQTEEHLPTIAILDVESIEEVLNAAYQDTEIEADVEDGSLNISVHYDGHDSLVEGVTQVMQVYQSFDEILGAESYEDFQKIK